MGYQLSIDPGTRGAGAAIFDTVTRQLHAARYIRNPIDGGRRLDAAIALAEAVFRWAGEEGVLVMRTVACEVMRSYNAGQQKGPQDDLIDVSLVSSACATLGKLRGADKLVTYYPAEWKSNLNPETCLERIIERLSLPEQGRIQLVGRTPLYDIPGSDSLDHNTLDAIGIGLKLLGRFEPVRSFARE
jgi:hypothetical protein